MTLRLRLLLAIGISFVLFWAASSVWMLVDLRSEFRATLDERLAASARMVAALVAQSAQPLSSPLAPAQLVSPLRPNDGVACEIRNARGSVLARTGNSPAGLNEVVPGFRTRTIDGVRWRSYTLVQDGIRVTTADRVTRREQLLRDVAYAALWPFLIALGGSLLALWLALRGGLAPLESIRNALAARAPDALQPLPAEGLPAELAPLVATVNGLLDRIERAIERERSFTGAAAHELRTPLTAVKTHLQVARMAGGGATSASSLGQAEQGVLRLQATIDQLLMLARLEGPFSFDDGAIPSALDIAAETLEHFEPAARARIQVEAGNGGEALLAVSAPLAASALRNLLDNALRHSPANAPVRLRLAGAQGMAWFSVEDQGPGMSAADLAQAPLRFWRKGDGAGSGLGLSIVDAIVRRCGGSWELAPRPGGGICARMGLPLA